MLTSDSEKGNRYLVTNESSWDGVNYKPGDTLTVHHTDTWTGNAQSLFGYINDGRRITQLLRSEVGERIMSNTHTIIEKFNQGDVVDHGGVEYTVEKYVTVLVARRKSNGELAEFDLTPNRYDFTEDFDETWASDSYEQLKLVDQKTEVTLEQIAAKFNVPVDKLKIKK